MGAVRTGVIITLPASVNTPGGHPLLASEVAVMLDSFGSLHTSAGHRRYRDTLQVGVYVVCKI